MARDAAARVAVVEVAMDVRVTVRLECEGATEAELARLVTREAANVRGAVVTRVERAGWQKTEVSAGWLDENREAFVTDVTAAESLAPANLGVVR